MSCYESVVYLRVGGVTDERRSRVSVAIFRIIRYATVLVHVTYIHQLRANGTLDPGVQEGRIGVFAGLVVGKP